MATPKGDIRAHIYALEQVEVDIERLSKGKSEAMCECYLQRSQHQHSTLMNTYMPYIFEHADHANNALQAAGWVAPACRQCKPKHVEVKCDVGCDWCTTDIAMAHECYVDVLVSIDA